jgi:hypothetical protein
VDLLVNDLSIHGQFSDLSSFRLAIDRVMAMRRIARRFGRDLYCHRNVAHAQVAPTLAMPSAIQALGVDVRRALMQWLTRQGPFWEDIRLHGRDDYLECRGEVVTDSAVGEAAYCSFHGFERHLVSLVPSSWQLTPVPVTWVTDADAVRAVEIDNHWDPDRLEAVLQRAPVPLESWKHLARVATTRCPGLTFASDSFEPLDGHPFGPGPAERILVLLEKLHTFKGCCDEQGRRTPEGQRLYQDHFTGDKAWFSDSSDSDKQDFRAKLTFRHPTAEGEFLFCPWHGKVKTPQFRIHFSWPVSADQPLYVVYVGPKITKR